MKCSYCGGRAGAEELAFVRELLHKSHQENERLRAALEKLAGVALRYLDCSVVPDYPEESIKYGEQVQVDLEMLAKAALEGK